MKVLLVNGSPHRKGCTYTALTIVAEALNQEGIETEIMQLGTEPIGGCIACMKCAETGRCFRDDIVNKFVDKIDECDGFVFGSPVHFAAASGAISSFMDRAFFVRGTNLAYKPGACVISCRRGGASAAFDELNKYFTIRNMPVVSSNYWNQVHGKTADEVLQDVEGVQTMRMLGKNMAWMLKLIDLGKRNGINPPAPEQKIYTNYIR